MDLADLVAAVIARLARDRVVQFGVLGAIVFAIAGSPASPRTIALSRDYLDALHAAQAERLGVGHLPDDKRGEVDRRAVEDEVLYREALRLGLDRDDGVVRRHLVQKMLVLAEDLGGASTEPTRDDVRAYFERTRARWRIAERVHLVHVYAGERATLVGLAGAVRDADRAHPDTPPPLGDAFPRARELRGSRADLAATYGDDFADAAIALPVGSWSEPVRSRFGWHLVKVIAHDGGRPATLAEVEDRVRLDCAVERRHAAIARYLAAASARYRIEVDGARVEQLEPTARIALRSAPSAED